MPINVFLLLDLERTPKVYTLVLLNFLSVMKFDTKVKAGETYAWTILPQEHILNKQTPQQHNADLPVPFFVSLFPALDKISLQNHRQSNTIAPWCSKHKCWCSTRCSNDDSESARKNQLRSSDDETISLSSSTAQTVIQLAWNPYDLLDALISRLTWSPATRHQAGKYNVLDTLYVSCEIFQVGEAALHRSLHTLRLHA